MTGEGVEPLLFLEEEEEREEEEVESDTMGVVGVI